MVLIKKPFVHIYVIYYRRMQQYIIYIERKSQIYIYRETEERERKRNERKSITYERKNLWKSRTKWERERKRKRMKTRKRAETREKEKTTHTTMSLWKRRWKEKEFMSIWELWERGGKREESMRDEWYMQEPEERKNDYTNHMFEWKKERALSRTMSRENPENARERDDELIYTIMREWQTWKPIYYMFILSIMRETLLRKKTIYAEENVVYSRTWETKEPERERTREKWKHPIVIMKRNLFVYVIIHSWKRTYISVVLR